MNNVIDKLSRLIEESFENPEHAQQEASSRGLEGVLSVSAACSEREAKEGRKNLDKIKRDLQSRTKKFTIIKISFRNYICLVTYQ